MGPQLTAYTYTVIALIIGGGLCSTAFGLRIASRVTLVWLMFLSIAYLTNLAVLAVAVFAFVFFIRKQSNDTRLFYFVTLLPILPLQSYFLPFPGLNYLWDINFIRLLILALFVPMMFDYLSRVRGGAKKKIHAADAFLVCFIVFVGAMAIRTGNVTFTLRELFSIFVDVGIPYFVISRFLVSSQALNWLFAGFLMSAVFICLFSLMESLGGWRFFTEVLFSLKLKYEWLALVPYSRGGFVRAAGGPMFQPLGFAYFASLALVVCFFFWQKKVLGVVPFVLFSSVFFLALLLTDSKGGLLALMVGVFLVAYLALHHSLRFVVKIGVCLMIPAVFAFLLSTNFAALDSEGSFSYRYQLILNAWPAVLQNPLFGSINFLENPQLQRSLQGEGIIDIVNLYLQVLLEYGLVGLFLYVMIFVSLIRGLIRTQYSSSDGINYRHLLLALLGMTMVFIITCSDVSFIPWYVMLLWALSRACIHFSVVNHSVNPSSTVSPNPFSARVSS